jgi:FAD/FMN-containing dehydrogenase
LAWLRYQQRAVPTRLSGDRYSDFSAISGIIDIDQTAAQARIKAGTAISAIGEPLWDAGLALKNQGAIDLQTIAGAVSTSTHGSGLQLTAGQCRIAAGACI